MPMDQDLCHVDHVKRSPRHRLPSACSDEGKISVREDHTSDDALAFPVGNYVSDTLGNYVSVTASAWGNR